MRWLAILLVFCTCASKQPSAAAPPVLTHSEPAATPPGCTQSATATDPASNDQGNDEAPDVDDKQQDQALTAEEKALAELQEAVELDDDDSDHDSNVNQFTYAKTQRLQLEWDGKYIPVDVKLYAHKGEYIVDVVSGGRLLVRRKTGALIPNEDGFKQTELIFHIDLLNDERHISDVVRIITGHDKITGKGMQTIQESVIGWDWDRGQFKATRLRTFTSGYGIGPDGMGVKVTTP
jgi:hypothetical protein